MGIKSFHNGATKSSEKGMVEAPILVQDYRPKKIDTFYGLTNVILKVNGTFLRSINISVEPVFRIVMVSYSRYYF